MSKLACMLEEMINFDVNKIINPIQSNTRGLNRKTGEYKQILETFSYAVSDIKI